MIRVYRINLPPSPRPPVKQNMIIFLQKWDAPSFCFAHHLIGKLKIMIIQPIKNRF
ncbi:hypothetical protein CWATWH0401_3972 [Crocosphaera watsonii WH 0401]|uniref:Uncharacterized protein n=1 Tax=Crocosphaera watsonii WH 0401 TaxID=555881 RepID=T2J444_CROWT|nr:hypothetical protein CWATWH0401_3972 [Crocosphaera watsonii WH 0401]